MGMPNEFARTETSCLANEGNRGHQIEEAAVIYRAYCSKYKNQPEGKDD